MYKSMQQKYDEIKNRPEKGVIDKPKKKIRSQTLQTIVIKRKHLDASIERQEGRCDICLNILSNKRRKMHLDHCHETGRLRGVLCVSCNLLLGHAGDKIENLERAIKYLIKHGKTKSEKPKKTTDDKIYEAALRNIDPAWGKLPDDPIDPIPVTEPDIPWWKNIKPVRLPKWHGKVPREWCPWYMLIKDIVFNQLN